MLVSSKPPHQHRPLRLLTIQTPLLTIQITPYRKLQLCRRRARHLRQILDIIARLHPKLAHKVLGRRLEVVVLPDLEFFFLRSAEVGVGGDGGGALEAL